MEKKMVHFTTVVCCAVSLFVCVAVWIFPYVEKGRGELYAWLMRDRIEREQRYALLEQMSGLEIMDYNTQMAKEAVQEGEAGAEEINFTQQMRLELPKGASGEEVGIVTDYVHQEIRIQLPGADKTYLYDYSIMGRSDEIEDLDYVSEGDGGTIVLTMTRVMEQKSSYDKTYLYLDFYTPKELYDYVVVVDAGHGADQPGAISGQYYEKNITLDIVKYIKELFDADEDEKIGVYYTRLDDSGPTLAERANLANSAQADLFVSIHINSLKNQSNVWGTGVMYDEQAEDTEFDTKDFAQICLEEELSALGSQDKGLIPGNSIYIIRSAQMPVALVEVGFMNNPQELARLLDASYQKKAALGIYNAVHRSLEQLDALE